MAFISEPFVWIGPEISWSDLPLQERIDRVSESHVCGFNSGLQVAAGHLERMGLRLAAREIRGYQMSESRPEK